MSSLGEAPIQIQATARKHRKMPMGRTGIAGLRLFIRWLRELSVFFTLYSAKTRLGGTDVYLCVLKPSSHTRGLFYVHSKLGGNFHMDGSPSSSHYTNQNPRTLRENDVLFTHNCTPCAIRSRRCLLFRQVYFVMCMQAVSE